MGTLEIDDNPDSLVAISPEVFTTQQLQVGDVLLVARGFNMRSVIVRAQDMGDIPLVVGVNCFILRAKPNLLLPEVLVSLLNSEYGQAWLATHNRATVTATISVGRLKEWQIDVPSQENQQKLADFFWQNIVTLQALNQLMQQHQRTASAVFQTLMPQGSHHDQ
ncbi:MAG: restriction endonuclease subunit S [Moraxella osloensis]